MLKIFVILICFGFSCVFGLQNPQVVEGECPFPAIICRFLEVLELLLTPIPIVEIPQICRANQAKCIDGKCIEISALCNGIVDCSTGEDESNCGFPTEQPVFCQTNQYQCTGGKCIEMTDYCNGVPDCSSGEDESNCEITEATCNTDSHFKCATGRCIPCTWVCDSILDCDEELECGTEKAPKCENSTAILFDNEYFG